MWMSLKNSNGVIGSSGASVESWRLVQRLVFCGEATNTPLPQTGHLGGVGAEDDTKEVEAHLLCSWHHMFLRKYLVTCESAFAPYVGFGVLMTSKLGTNVILMRYVTAISPMKDLKS